MDLADTDQIAIDHRAFVASLSPEDAVRLTEKSDAAGLARLAFHWGAILFLGALIVARVPLWPALMLPQGILVVFLFTALHETSHRTPFAARWINDAVARVCGFLILLPAEWFRFFHFAHHRHTQDPDNDPELIAGGKPETLRQYVVHVTGLPVWSGEIKTLLRNAAGRRDDTFVPEKARGRVAREVRMMLALYALLAAGSVWSGSTVLLWVWVVPSLIGQPFLRLYLLAEHGRCAFVANMLENTRTTFTNRLVKLIAWNMPYHVEHHSMPTVPFHRLPQLHALMRGHLKVTERGYARFNWKYVATLSRS
jgi:fatty acid desaturase